MKLSTVQVRMFRNILDSTSVDIDEQVTALVGKNESGKTSFLTALARLNPAQNAEKFSVNADYPAWLEKRHRLQGKKLEDVHPVQAIFTVEPNDMAVLASKFGPGAVKATSISLARSYSGQLLVSGYSSDEASAVAHVVSQSGVERTAAPDAHSARTFEELQQSVQALKATAAPAAVALEQATAAVLAAGAAGSLSEAVHSAFLDLIPKFFYFAHYSSLPKQVEIRKLLEKPADQLTPDEQTAVALLRLAATDDAYLLNANYELRKRELENVANAITGEVLEFWTQNPDLRVHIDLTQVTVPAQPSGQQAVIDELMVRVWDDRHRLSLPFGGRSSGFQWFFCFLAGFSRYEQTKEPLVILLDEPALGLHARAQADFLRFIEKRLAVAHQVVYTTHSPFMIEPGKLERVRIVEDRGREVGSAVSKDVLATDPDTVFPLQSALGYDLAQHLFVGSHNLVVEGTSDFTYLTTLSDHLRATGREGLDPRWSVVPVGGADMVPTFVALLGHHLDVTVLVDSRKSGHQKLERLVAQGLMAMNRVLIVGDVLSRPSSDIEDAFDPEDYLALYNRAFGETLTTTMLLGTDSIVARIARHKGVERFDHGKPADLFLRSRDQVIPSLKPATLDAFDKIFRAINATLKLAQPGPAAAGTGR